MLKKHSAVLFFPVLVLFSCSVGVKKDLMSGLSIAYDGFTAGDAYIVCEGKKLASGNAKFGSEITLAIDDISGFRPATGRLYPGCSMDVLDQAGKSVLHYDDLYTEYDATGIHPDSLNFVSASLTIGQPMAPHESYTWKVRFWDKKSEAVLNAEVTVHITD